MSRAAGIRLILLLLLTVPIPAIVLADLLDGELGQPLDDYLFLHVAALIVLAPAAALTTACFVWRGFGTPRLHDLIVYAFLAAAGSAVFMTVLDAWDDYFTRPGIRLGLADFGARARPDVRNSLPGRGSLDREAARG